MKKTNKTQQKILSAAKKIYRRVGYTGSTFQMIAELSNTSKSLINYYYPKKQDILVDIMSRYLDTIHDYIASLEKYDTLMTFLLTKTLFIKSLLSDRETSDFYADVNTRTDRDLGPYLNYHYIYEAINKEFDLGISEEAMMIKCITIFGSTNELLMNYRRKTISLDENQIIELILRDTCSLLQLNNFTVHKYMNELWHEYSLLERKRFPFFDV